MADLDYKEVLAALQLATRQLADRKRSDGSRYPYYTEEAANEVLDTIATCLSTGRPIVWQASGVSVNTVYNKFRQGVRYVIDNMDPDFEKKLRYVQATRIPKVGLRITPRSYAGTDAIVDPNWRKDFERFLEEADVGQAFERFNLALGDADIEYITSTLYELRTLFMYELPDKSNNNRLLIVRTASRSNDNPGNPESPDRETRSFIGDGVDEPTGPANSIG